MKDHKRIRERGWIALKIGVAFLASVFVGCFSASEIFAVQTHFAPALGAHYGYLYAPWSIIVWWHLWHETIASLFTAPAWLGTSIGAFCLLICVVKVVLLSDPEKPADQVWADMLVYLHRDGETDPLVARLPAINSIVRKKRPDQCFPQPSLI